MARSAEFLLEQIRQILASGESGGCQGPPGIVGSRHRTRGGVL